MSEPFFPSQRIDISGPDGNAWAIMGRLSSIFRQCGGSVAGVPWETVQEEMMAGDYENLLDVAGRYVVIEAHDAGDGDDDDSFHCCMCGVDVTDGSGYDEFCDPCWEEEEAM